MSFDFNPFNPVLCQTQPSDIKFEKNSELLIEDFIIEND